MPLNRSASDTSAQGRYHRGWLFLAATLLLTSGLLAVVPAIGGAATDTTSDTTTEPVKFGMGPGSIERQKDAGVAPDYGTFWVGPWTLKHGWGGPSNQLDTMKAAGVTPAIHYYYWGDDISPTCVEDGCYSDLHDAWKDRAGWQQLAEELVVELRDHMDGEPVVILLETEFNKGGISTYEPFDTYMAEKAQFLEQEYPAAEVVMPLGNWNSGAWDTFDQTAAEAEYVGLQGMRGSTRDSLDSYRNLYEDTLQGVQKLEQLFGKPILIHDIALSSYPEPDYVDHQADELEEFFSGMDDLKAAGVEGLIYRSWFDAPNMDLGNYYGEAERHWGFERAYDEGLKPSAQVWIDGVKAERDGTTSVSSTASGVPVDASTAASVEAESFDTKTAGGQQAHSTASGGAFWNLWSNGYIAQAFDVQEAGTYQVDVRADGQELDGIAPHMVVRLDGTNVLEADVPAGGWSHHTVDVDVTSTGDHELRIAFTNDAVSTDEDRNLLLDKVDVAWTGGNRAPSASFETSLTDRTVDVDASGSSDPDGDALGYAWDWGDGATSTGATASHTYEADGTYTVTLTVTDPDGASDSSQKDVSVSAHASGVPVDRSGTASVEAEAFDTKTAGGQQGDGAASGDAFWNLWANGYIGQAFDVQEAGTYEIQVRADGQELGGIAPHMVVGLDGTTLFEADVPAGGWSTYAAQVDLATGAQTLEIAFTNDAVSTDEDRNLLLDNVDIVPTQTNSAPSASFTASTSDLTVSTDGGGSSDPDGDALSYAWDWGDGATDTGATASHTYAAEGTYTVTLTVSDPDGASDTATEEVTVTEPNSAPSASFTASTSDLSVSADASGSSDPDGDALGYAWDWGDGATSTGVTASHTYEAGGTYTVTLTVTDPEGASDTATQEATVTEPNRAPAAGFTHDCTDLTCKFDASQSSDPDGDTITYGWTLGDGSTARGVSVEHAYAAAGTYDVELTVDDGQAQDRHVDAVSVTEPADDFTASFRVAENVNEWWVEVYVDASTTPDGVEARVDGGPWRTLEAKDWGSWAESFHVPAGSTVTFQATAGSQTVTSGGYVWG